MKLKALLIGSAVAIFALSSCASETDKTENTTEETKTETTEEAPAEATTYNANTETSVVNWSGGIVGGGYGHTGTLKLSEGSIELTGDAITGGSFVVDMKSIQTTDSAYSEDKTPEMLIGHLSTGDFFLVDSFATAKFVINSVEGNSVSGDLTIRDKTNPATITDVTVEENEGSVKASGNLVFNRQQFDVAYTSSMKDMVISDDITLEISLEASK